MKRLMIMLLALVASSASFASDIPSDYKLVLLCDSYPPYSMTIDDRNFGRGEDLDGITVEIIRGMMERTGIDHSITLRFPYSRLLEYAKRKHNAGVFTVNRSSQNENDYKWIGPVTTQPWMLFASNKSNVTIKNLDDAKGLKIVAQKGQPIIARLRAKGLTVEEAISPLAAAKRVDEGEADLWIMSELPARYTAQQEGIELRAVYTVEHDENWIAVNPQVPDAVVRALQNALDDMKRDGTIEQIRSQYL